MATFVMVGRRLLIALAASLVCLLPGCASSRYEFVSNKGLGVYLKVPKSWDDFGQDELLPLYAEPGEEPSAEAFQILKQLMWERAWDSSRRPGVENLYLGAANAPVARLAVRSLTPDQQKAMSLETLRNLTLAGYSESLVAFKELLRNPGTSDLVGADFVPLEDADLRPGRATGVREGFSGVRQVYEARRDDKSLYAIAFIGLVDDARTRIYTLTVHCSRSCYVQNERTIQQVLDSFTVRKV